MDRNCARLMNGNMPEAVRSLEAFIFIEGDVSSMPSKPVCIVSSMPSKPTAFPIEEELDLKFVSKESVFITRSIHLPSFGPLSHHNIWKV
jgi:hypothetical protein